MRLLRLGIVFIATCTLADFALAQSKPDWSSEQRIPQEGRWNPYELSENEFLRVRTHGLSHAAYYPVANTGMIFPYYPVKALLEASSSNPLKRWFARFFGVFSPFENFEDLQAWLGLSFFPSASDDHFQIPDKNLSVPDHRLGLTFKETEQGLGFTVSCAQCHSSQLFGKTVLGMSARFPRANELFSYALKAVPLVGPKSFRWWAEATEGEVLMFERVKERLKFIGAKKPVQLGLDTSLAQVALSLAKRDQDEWATKSQRRWRHDPLRRHIADSKPAVWWNVKYKNRWLSDGSVVSGNPIVTNLLWNEIGRGADLKDFADWIETNPEIIQELTTAVFSNTAPHWTDFFPAESINELEARRGEVHFNMACAKCHGTYRKNWSHPEAQLMSPSERLKTWQVNYHEKTPVIDVGTDPGRYQGMQSLNVLNQLAISKSHGIRVETQKGYVPPPLVGIWARWPYFHNNSAPSLCAVLTRSKDRPRSYWARSPNDPEEDFDAACNGYPLERPIGASRDYFYSTRKKGLSNMGHDDGIFLRKGQEIFSPQEKKELVQYLQTL